MPTQPLSAQSAVAFAPGLAAGVVVALALGAVMLGPQLPLESLARSHGTAGAALQPGGLGSPRPAGHPTAAIARDWLARRSDGTWLLGRAARPTALEPSEIGLAIAGGWVVTTDQASYGRSISWRRVDGAAKRTAALSVVPASVAVAGATAYVGGFDAASGGDPGLVALNLLDGSSRQAIAGTSGRHPRSVVASGDASRVVSATCGDDAMCDLTALSAASGGAARTVPAPGYLRSTTSSVAIVGSDPASWIAGIDLTTGHELWRRSALEMWSGYTTSAGLLVQAELRQTVNGPTFAVEVVSPETGVSSTRLMAAVEHGIGLWPELSSDEAFAIGTAYSLDDALAKANGRPIQVRLFAVADGREMGSVSIDGGS